MLVDLQRDVAHATLTVDENIVATSPELGFSVFTTQSFGFQAYALVNDSNEPLGLDFGADDSLAVNLHELSVAVPEPSTTLLLASSLATLAALAAQRSRRARRERILDASSEKKPCSI